MFVAGVVVGGCVSPEPLTRRMRFGVAAEAFVTAPVVAPDTIACAIFFADFLDQFRIAGFKLGFWMAHQGAMYVFVGLIAFYIWFMNRLDRKYDVHEN